MRPGEAAGARTATNSWMSDWMVYDAVARTPAALTMSGSTVAAPPARKPIGWCATSRL